MMIGLPNPDFSFTGGSDDDDDDDDDIDDIDADDDEDDDFSKKYVFHSSTAPACSTCFFPPKIMELIWFSIH